MEKMISSNGCVNVLFLHPRLVQNAKITTFIRSISYRRRQIIININIIVKTILSVLTNNSDLLRFEILQW